MRPRSFVLLVAALAGGGAACAHTEAAMTPEPVTANAVVEHGAPGWQSTRELEVQAGMASWYGGKLAGRRTASGERFNPHAMTAAHRTLPFGTWVEVTRSDTGQHVRVRVTDRGPYKHERIIDLSRAAAERLGMLRDGVARVELRIVDGP